MTKKTLRADLLWAVSTIVVAISAAGIIHAGMTWAALWHAVAAPVFLLPLAVRLLGGPEQVPPLPKTTLDKKGADK